MCWKIEKEEIIKDNKEVFVEPKGLPPRRTIDHKIPLKERVEAINVRPYRYPYLKKSN